MATVLTFLIIFVPVWIICQLTSFGVGLSQGMWWGLTVRGDLGLWQRVTEPPSPDAPSPTGWALLISGLIWWFA
ncbi:MULTISPECIES: hypothetical protein [unclassified Bradyrhizobium]|uniref:hypothetical protein n=1 Tax=unclassified Bradyrhizobium TaxID=2631580 RepID=UPI002916F3A7|nr:MULTISPECIES: hypothetical protein [unclassified Bradyrhizobium]